MEMQHVRYFLALAKTLNFTRAAEMANVSQPALTRAIQQLEYEMGGPLFHRERQNTHLSELGRMMLPFLEDIQEQTEAAKAQARNARKAENVTLKIGVMCTIAPAMISDLLLRFSEAHPSIDIEMYDKGAGDLQDMLSAGDLHLALFGLPEGPDVRFHGLPLFEERFVVAVSPKHPFARQNIVHCREIDGQAYVNRANCEYADYASRKLSEQGVMARRVFSSDRDDWVQAMIRAGMGFGFFPEYSVTDPDIVARRLIEPEFVRTIMLLTVRGRPHSPAVGAFVRAARMFDWPGGRLDPMPKPEVEPA